VASGEVNESEGIFVSTGTSNFTIANVHADGIEGFLGLLEEFTMLVPVDCGHVSDSQRWVAFMVDLQSNASEFEHTPIMECMASEHALEIIA
jgi:hypothetical protein